MDHACQESRLLKEPLSPGDLLHILTCPVCRDGMVHLLEQEARFSEDDPDDDTVDEYAGLWDKLAEVSPEVLETGRRRREEAKRLFQELLREQPDGREALLRTDRFRSLDLLEFLLESSYANQLPDPAHAEELAAIAELAAVAVKVMEALPRAYCLAASAKRLRHNLEAAEIEMTKAVPFLSLCPTERAFYCRTAALVRWDQGGVEEAAALFQRAAHLYASQEGPKEQANCLALLGLLRFEEGEPFSSLPTLCNGWAKMDRLAWPSLAIRVGFTLVSALAIAGQGDHAKAVEREVWPLFSEIHDEQDLVRAYWHQGRALTLLKQTTEGLQVLESVRGKVVEERRPGEAALVSLDLALALAESGEVQRISPLAESLHSCFEERQAPGLDIAAKTLAHVAHLASQGEPHLPEQVVAISAFLRRSLRAIGVRTSPVPCA